jgi:hypothetical protein
MGFASFQTTITDENGVIVPHAIVSVNQEIPGSPLAVLYEDREGFIGKTNPCFADAQGFVQFFTDGGAYQITATNDAVTFSRTWRYVGIGTMQEYDYGTVLLPQGAWNAATLYNVGDLVSHTYPGGSPFAFVSNINNNENHAPQFTDATHPISDTYWTVLGMFEGVGAPGSPGAVGPAGPNLGLEYDFVSGPTLLPGQFAVDNADLTLTTLIAFHPNDVHLTDHIAYLNAQGQSTNPVKGSIMVIDIEDGTNWLALKLLSPFDAEHIASVDYVDHNGDLIGARCGVLFTDAGDRGIDGVDGVDGAPGAPGTDASGDVVGPSSVLQDQFATYANDTGKLIKSDTSSLLVAGQPWFRKPGGAAVGPVAGGAIADGILLGGGIAGVMFGLGAPVNANMTVNPGSLYLEQSAGNTIGAAWIKDAAANFSRLLTTGLTDLQIFTATATLLAAQRPAPEEWAADELVITPLTALTGNITVGPTTRKLLLIGQAAGGGGGGVGNTGGPGCGGGGGPGETRMAIVTVTPGQVIPFSIGAEGVGSAASASAGGTAADLTIGTAGALMICKGGLQGFGANAVAGTPGGAPPNGSGGIRIEPTGLGIGVSQGGGVWNMSGSTIFGRAAHYGITAGGGNGQPGGGYGSGGGGALHMSTQTGAGSQGQPGMILLLGFGG